MILAVAVLLQFLITLLLALLLLVLDLVQARQ
jgi:hypothetical protein